MVEYKFKRAHQICPLIAVNLALWYVHILISLCQLTASPAVSRPPHLPHRWTCERAPAPLNTWFHLPFIINHAVPRIIMPRCRISSALPVTFACYSFILHSDWPCVLLDLSIVAWINTCISPFVPLTCKHRGLLSCLTPARPFDYDSSLSSSLLYHLHLLDIYFLLSRCPCVPTFKSYLFPRLTSSSSNWFWFIYVWFCVVFSYIQ